MMKAESEKMVMPVIKAVVFDFDGLLIDTETPLYQAYERIFQEHGVELSMEHWSSFLGTNRHTIDYLEECLGRAVYRPVIEQRVMDLHDEWMEHQGLQPGVAACLQEARQMGLKVGLCSSSLRLRIETYLRKFRLLDYFDCIRTGNDAGRGKPDPELYASVLRGLGVSPSEAIAFEDSVHGLQAAKRAGLICVIVPNRITSHLVFAGYDLRIDSLAEIGLEELIARLHGKNQARETTEGGNVSD